MIGGIPRNSRPTCGAAVLNAQIPRGRLEWSVMTNDNERSGTGFQEVECMLTTIVSFFVTSVTSAASRSSGSAIAERPGRFLMW